MSTGERQHYWDALRALLMLLGIPFHASLVFSTQVKWLVAASEDSAFLTFFGEFTHIFRMPAFFLVSGYFGALLLRRRETKTWLKSRAVRLLIPLVTTMLLIQPVQIVAERLAPAINGEISYSAAIRDIEAFFLEPFGPRWIGQLWIDWISQLWFLPVLFLFSIILALLWPLRRLAAVRSLQGPFRAAGRVHPDLPVLIMGLVVVAQEVLEVAVLGPSPLSFLASSFVFFMLGALIGAKGSLLEGFRSTNRVEITLALAVCAAVAAVRTFGAPPLQVGHVAIPAPNPLADIGATIGAFLVAKVLIATFSTQFHNENPHIRNVVDASFTMYLVHQQIIVLLSILFLLTPFPVLFEFSMTVLLTSVLSFLFHLLVKRSAFLLLLFNGVLPSSRPRPASAQQAST